MIFKHHFKYDKKRGLLMTQAGGKLHYEFNSFGGNICEVVTEFLNECFYDWDLHRTSKITKSFDLCKWNEFYEWCKGVRSCKSCIYRDESRLDACYKRWVRDNKKDVAK